MCPGSSIRSPRRDSNSGFQIGDLLVLS